MRFRLNFVLAVVFLCLPVFVGCVQQNSYSLADQLPSSLEIVESFVDTSGMDAFHMVKAKYNSTDEIKEICEEFELSPCAEPQETVAELFDKKHLIAWFPMSNPTQCYCDCSVNPDGTFNEDVEYRFVVYVLWVDEERQELIFQAAAL